MKKIIRAISVFLTVAILMLCVNVCVYAAEILVEAENQPGKYTVQEFGNIVSGGKLLIMYSSSTNRLTQTFIAAESGEYMLTIRYGLYGHNQNTDLSVSVNGGDFIKLGDDTAKIAADGYSNDMGSCGAVTRSLNEMFYLEAGENKITFLNDGSILSPWGQYATAQRIDYYKFTSVDGRDASNIAEVEGINSSFNVFEKSQNIAFKIKTMAPAAENRTYNFEVTDFWGKKIIDSTLTVIKGRDSLTLDLGKFDLGWYKIKITDSGRTYYDKGFSVIHPYAERTLYDDTPFGFDFASTWHGGDNESIAKYTKAARLAGATWVRERYSWGDVERSRGKFTFENIARGADIIAESGLKIIDMFSEKPQWAGLSGFQHMPENLFDVYELQKQTAAHFKGKIQAWEIWNEQDGGFWADTEDDIAALIKAGAIGLDDSGADVIKAYGGLSVAPNDGLKGSALNAEHFYMNDVINYSDINNFHVYSFDNYMINGFDIHDRGNSIRNTSNAYYGKNDKLLWCTETALTITVGTPDTSELLHSQARGAVTVMADHIANGVRRMNYFIIPHYMEGSASYGVFADGYPYAVYSTFSNMSYQLGKADYKGEMANLPAGAKGYLFDNGKQDVAVVWGDRVSAISLKNTKNAVMTDMFGIETKLKDNPTVSFSNYPIFIRFDGRADSENYYPTALPSSYTSTGEREIKHFKDNEKIVLRQKFDGEYTAQTKYDGHSCDLENGEKVTLEVYNFNDTEQKIDLNAEIGPGLEIYPANASITVGAMAKGTAEFTVRFKNRDDCVGEWAFLKFDGNTEHGKVSRSVSKIALGGQLAETEPDFVFENSKIASGWEVEGNANAGTVVNTSDSEGGVKFGISWGDGDKWFYPYFKITDKERQLLKGKNMLCFKMYMPEYIPYFRGHVFITTNDGRKYWISEGMQYKAGWNQYNVDLDKIELNSSPLGALDARKFELSDADKLSIGCNSVYDRAQPYIIKDIGCYAKEDESANIFKVEGIEDGGKTKAGEDVNINITVADGMDMSTARLMLNEKEFTDFTVNGNVVSVNLKNIARGDYTLFIACEKPYIDDIKRTTVSFRAE